MQYREQEGTTNLRVKEEADFSVVLFRSNFTLFSEKNRMKIHTNQWLRAMPYPPERLAGATNQGTHHGVWGADAFAVP
jgi:hypothetical protein